jgi:hypothetical protein
MPVSLLLCEGEANCPDVRVLTKLLAGRCAVLPSGGKYGMGDRIKARREAIGKGTIYGLLDGDFVADFAIPTNQPRLWRGSDKTHLGWRWERKEIENYLVDPEVVRRALGAPAPSPADYRTTVEQARDAITVYQAARIALSVRRPRFSPLANCFGPERGKGRHPFPDALDETSCLDGIRQVVADYQARLVVSNADIQGEFKTRLPECQPGGPRFNAFFHAFSGKDLVWSMTPALQAFGFASAATFLERILVGIEQTTDDLGAWLAEWGALQLLMDSA